MPIEISWPEVNAMRWDIELKQNIQNIVDAVEPLEATVDTISSTPRTYTATQTFDAEQGWQLGGRLKFTEHIGFAGDRLAVGGQYEGVMPYVEVVPTTRTGTDPGGSIAGYQVYGTVYGGAHDAPGREFLAIEAKGELYSAGVMFRIGTWASGTGQYRPIRIGIGDLNIVDFTSNGVQGGAASTEGRIELLSKTKIYSIGNTLPQMIDFQRGTSGAAVREIVAQSSGSAGGSIVLGRTRGSLGAPTNLAAADRIGSIHFNSYRPGEPVSDTSEQIVAYMRGETNESYSSFDTARGSRITFGITQQGTVTLTDAARIADPANADETSLLVLVNRAGVKALSRVKVGATNTGPGGAGRVLYVDN